MTSASLALSSAFPLPRLPGPISPCHLFAYGIAGATIDGLTQLLQGHEFSGRRLIAAFLSGATCGALGQLGPSVVLQGSAQNFMKVFAETRGIQRIEFFIRAGLCGSLEGGALAFVDAHLVNLLDPKIKNSDKKSESDIPTSVLTGVILGFFLGPLVNWTQNRFQRQVCALQPVQNNVASKIFAPPPKHAHIHFSGRSGSRNPHFPDPRRTVFEEEPFRNVFDGRCTPDYREGEDITEEILSRILAMMPIPLRPPQLVGKRLLPRVLEIGAGDGTMTDIVSRRLRSPVLATDFHAPPRAEHSMVSNMRDLREIPDGHMDLVFGLHSVEYNRLLEPNPFEAIGRVLKEGGSLVLLVHHRDSFITTMARHQTIALPQGSPYLRAAQEIVRIAYPDRQTLVLDLMTHGFDRINIRPCGAGRFIAAGRLIESDVGWIVTAVKRSS